MAVSGPQTVPREAETRSEGSFGNPLRLYVGAVQYGCHLTDKQRLGLMVGYKFRGEKSRKRGSFTNLLLACKVVSWYPWGVSAQNCCGYQNS